MADGGAEQHRNTLRAGMRTISDCRRGGADYLPVSNCINIYLLLIAQPAAKGSCIKHQLAHSTTGFFFGGCQKGFG